MRKQSYKLDDMVKDDGQQRRRLRHDGNDGLGLIRLQPTKHVNDAMHNVVIFPVVPKHDGSYHEIAVILEKTGV